jgi:hypothetical protein
MNRAAATIRVLSMGPSAGPYYLEIHGRVPVIFSNGLSLAPDNRELEIMKLIWSTG